MDPLTPPVQSNCPKTPERCVQHKMADFLERKEKERKKRKVSTLSLGGRWLKPTQVIPKTLTMVHAASLLDTQHLKGQSMDK